MTYHEEEALETIQEFTVNTPDAFLESWLMEIQRLQEIISAHEEEIDSIRQGLIEYVEAFGSFENNVAKVSMTKPSVSISYDSKTVTGVLALLTSLAHTNPEFTPALEMLSGAKKESQRSGSLRIKFK